MLLEILGYEINFNVKKMSFKILNMLCAEDKYLKKLKQLQEAQKGATVSVYLPFLLLERHASLLLSLLTLEALACIGVDQLWVWCTAVLP